MIRIWNDFGTGYELTEKGALCYNADRRKAAKERRIRKEMDLMTAFNMVMES